MDQGKGDGRGGVSMDRSLNELGRVVRESWVTYCIANGDTKPSHIAPWEELGDFDQGADIAIAEGIIRHLMKRSSYLLVQNTTQDGDVRVNQKTPLVFLRDQLKESTATILEQDATNDQRT